MDQNPEANLLDIQPPQHFDPNDVIEVDPAQYLEVQCSDSDQCLCDRCVNRVYDNFVREQNLLQEIENCFLTDKSLRRGIEINAQRFKDLCTQLEAVRANQKKK